jgi:GT2 family glycosyltransferase/glycosyltransferase involved in cell wall biosynthesis
MRLLSEMEIAYQVRSNSWWIYSMVDGRCKRDVSSKIRVRDLAQKSKQVKRVMTSFGSLGGLNYSGEFLRGNAFPLHSTAMESPFYGSENFEPKFFTGGPTRFYLPLFFDIVVQEKPTLIVTLGLGDPQAHLAFCQAVTEQNLSSHCVAVWRLRVGEAAIDDPAWQCAQKATRDFFATVSRLVEADALTSAADFADGSIDVLLIDDVDSGESVWRELEAWRPKLSDKALLLLHGTDLDREDSPRRAWANFVKDKAVVYFGQGIGLSIATENAAAKASPFRVTLFEGTAVLAQGYQVVAESIRARAQTRLAEHRAGFFEARQAVFDTIVEDRTKAQRVIEDQERRLGAIVEDRAKAQSLIEEQERQFESLSRDRADAQVVMDNQFAQIQKMHGKLTEQKQALTAAKAACRKKGRCFVIRKGSRPQASVGERIAREFARIPRNLRRILFAPPAPSQQKKTEATPIEKKYAEWITQHEPATDELEKQQRESSTWERRPKISLLIPLFDPPAKFLNELFASIVAQTYDGWEAYVVDAARNRETEQSLRRWTKSDARIQVQRYENLGISENTNRALQAATGDFVALVDHDDVLAPFALYELASAIRRQPAADILYSDEDRLLESGQRAKPFFKPEWSPELLYSFMYIGHLSAYRRELALALGGFRKEFDLSQDYDFALRATDRSRQIVHIPHILYHWREHAASGASGGKPEARKTNIAALVDAVKRRGLDAEVLEYPTANRVRMCLQQAVRVSVIIPTDSPARAEKCARDLPAVTDYPNAEFIIVTNTELIQRISASAQPISSQVRFVPFDKPFNFSAKCNAGAKAASGERIIFLNDDVETGQRDWIENVIEPLENKEVGAVAPKLLYPTGRIQHAGLVTGVRGLVGTALHQWPGDSLDYTNFAQSMRTVSALSAACIAMRRADFFAVGGFDEINAPIAHSDLDLCFKVREAGMRCVYTPFTTMTHHGRTSIGAEKQTPKVPTVDKSSMFLLQRWGQFTCHDPYYPNNMRDWLYHDSPEPIQMFARRNSAGKKSRRDVLLVSHDLSLSGAPIMVSHLAKWCKSQGLFVVVMSPVDGPLRETFLEAEIPVIIDPLLATGYEGFTKFGRQLPIKSHRSFIRFARDFDCIVASTIFAAPLIRDVRMEGIPHIWWIHEGLVGDHFLRKYSVLPIVLGLAELIVTPDKFSRGIYQAFARRPIRVVPYGIPAIAQGHAAAPERRVGVLRFLLLGSIEHRKGQQTLLEALRDLPLDVLDRCEFLIVGRPHDAKLAAEIKAAVENSAHVRLREAVAHEDALTLIQEADVMLCTSSDETGPLILIEAMALGKTILSTKVGVVGEKLVAEKDALFVEPADAIGLADAIRRLVGDSKLVQKLAINARNAYEKYFGLERFGCEFLAVVEKAILNAVPSDKAPCRSGDDPGTKGISHLSERAVKNPQNFAFR